MARMPRQPVPTVMACRVTMVCRDWVVRVVLRVVEVVAMMRRSVLQSFAEVLGLALVVVSVVWKVVTAVLPPVTTTISAPAEHTAQMHMQIMQRPIATLP
ncbi:hypothetical protein RHOFW104T7_15380 [Rhodanobacter thiooxydans]|uniref:Uncharacterized protein n=1 Tax=Rhodanobacter thiooxydans TaxID=416169 RepID=A0A154QFZ3_9GAMM|nr:hypothetical protein UUA_12870 [Rhodanobacter thiooxydans LCS2]KZC23086.1 hypothetical protein RHOFW104T7_15380 [Rhodanobacter thiooxydans]